MTDKEAFEQLKRKSYFKGYLMMSSIIFGFLSSIGIGVIIGMGILAYCIVQGMTDNNIWLWICVAACTLTGIFLIVLSRLMLKKDKDHLYNPNSLDHGIVTSIQKSREYDVLTAERGNTNGYTTVVYYTVTTDDGVMFVTTRNMHASDDRIVEGDFVYIANYGDSKYSRDTLIYKL